MQLRNLSQESTYLRIGIILLAIISALIAGASGFVYPSFLSPIIAGGVVAGVVIIITWLQKPVWAMYAAIFVVLLPIGLIPPQAHSLLNRSITIIAFVVWVVDVIINQHRVRWTKTALIMLVFLAWGFATLLWSTNLSIGIHILQRYALRFVLFILLIPNEIRTKDNLDGLMNTLAISGWVLVLVSLYTIMLEGYTPGTRLEVLNVNENGLGILALITMPGVLWQATQPLTRYKTIKFILASIYLILVVGLVAMSGSRGSALSLFIVLTAFWFWRPTRLWGKVSLIILVLVVLIAPFLFETTLERFAVIPGDTLLGGREGIWQASRLLILDNPWFGGGIGNARYSIMAYLSSFRSTLGFDQASIHNPVLTIWSETGVLGMFLYLSVLGSAIWSFVRQYILHRQERESFLLPYIALISSVFLGYIVSWIKGGGMESGFSYFFLLALLLIPSGLETKEIDDNMEINSQDVNGDKNLVMEASEQQPGWSHN